MDTVVTTPAAIDYGSGAATDRVTFKGCKWHIDATGTLHIARESGERGNCAAFAAGAWSTVSRGAAFAEAAS